MRKSDYINDDTTKVLHMLYMWLESYIIHEVAPITASGCVIHVYLINSLIQMYVCKYVHVCTCMYVFLYVVCMYMYIKALRYLD